MIISAEQNSDNQKVFEVFDPKKLTISNKPNSNQYGAFYQIKYDNRFLVIQLPQLPSYGISRYDEDTPYKLSVILKGVEVGDEVTEKLKDDTIKIFKDLITAFKEEFQKLEIFKEKKKKKEWMESFTNLSCFTIKYSEHEEDENKEIDKILMYPKITLDNQSKNNYYRTKFFEREKILPQEKAIQSYLKQRNSVICLIHVDSFFVSGKGVYPSLKLSQAMFFQKSENDYKIHLPPRLLNKIQDLSMEDKKSDNFLNDTVLDSDSDSDSDSPLQFIKPAVY
jgi:hypothetical protein